MKKFGMALAIILGLAINIGAFILFFQLTVHFLKWTLG
jgi:hypothetical protein